MYYVLVHNHISKSFEAKNEEFIAVDFEGKGRVWVKDCHGNLTKISRKDISSIEMDFRIAELFK